MSEPTEISGLKLNGDGSKGAGIVVEQPPMRGAIAQVEGQPCTVPYVCVVGIGSDILDEIANRVVAKLNGTPPPAASVAQDDNLPAEAPAAA